MSIGINLPIGKRKNEKRKKAAIAQKNNNCLYHAPKYAKLASLGIIFKKMILKKLKCSIWE